MLQRVYNSISLGGSDQVFSYSATTKVTIFEICRRVCVTLYRLSAEPLAGSAMPAHYVACAVFG